MTDSITPFLALVLLWLIGSAVTYKLGLALQMPPRAFNVVDLYAWPAILAVLICAATVKAAREGLGGLSHE